MRSGWVFALIYMYNYEIVLKYAVYGTVDQIAQEEGPPWSPHGSSFFLASPIVPAYPFSNWVGKISFPAGRCRTYWR